MRIRPISVRPHNRTSCPASSSPITRRSTTTTSSACGGPPSSTASESRILIRSTGSLPTFTRRFCRRTTCASPGRTTRLWAFWPRTASLSRSCTYGSATTAKESARTCCHWQNATPQVVCGCTPFSRTWLRGASMNIMASPLWSSASSPRGNWRMSSTSGSGAKVRPNPSVEATRNGMGRSGAKWSSSPPRPMPLRAPLFYLQNGYSTNIKKVR